MTILKLLIVSLLVSQIFAGQGTDISCNGTGCQSPTNCPTPPTATPALSWVNGTGSGKCAINSCPSSGTQVVGATDLYCQSCPGTPNGNIQAVFASSAGNVCVASTGSCGNSRAPNTWTNSDCLQCNSLAGSQAKSDQSVCLVNLIPGVDVNCTGTGCSSPANCPNPPISSAPYNLAWKAGTAFGKCAVTQCPPYGTDVTGVTDLYCQSCPGTPKGNVLGVFANTAGNACVASTATCGNSRAANTWTDADCLACNGNTAQYAMADKSGCQANPIPGADVSCIGTGCASPANCQTPPTSTPALSWVSGKGAGKCAINTCPKSGTSITGATDLYCQSCPGTPNGNVLAVFANTAGNACVASTATCGNSRAANTWTDADCLACNGNTTQYANIDKSGCQANPIPPGADVSCTGTGCNSPANCPTPPTSTLALSWVSGKIAGKCAINTCPKSDTSITGATDLYCQSCPGTTNGNVLAVFANNSGNACVASLGTCGNSRTANTWTNTDCLACNGPTKQYAKQDKSGCLSTDPSSNSMILLSSILFLITFLL